MAGPESLRCRNRRAGPSCLTRVYSGDDDTRKVAPVKTESREIASRPMNYETPQSRLTGSLDAPQWISTCPTDWGFCEIL